MEPFQLISLVMNSHPSDKEENEGRGKKKSFVPTFVFPLEQRGVADSKHLSLSFPALIDQSPSCHLNDKIHIKPVITEWKS